MSKFQAILFDLDGVIISSEDLHAQAKKMTLEKYGIDYPKNLFNDFKGRPDIVFWEHVCRNLAHGIYHPGELDAFKRTIFLELSENMSLIPGALEFIASAREMFPHMALVTSATEADLMVSEKKFNFLKWFDVVQLGEHTTHHKPHPEPYIIALSQLGVAPSFAVAIEDSPNGVRSARAAGCKVIGITTGFVANDLEEAGADPVLDSFTQINRYLRTYSSEGRSLL